MARVKGGLFTTLLDVNKRFPLDSRMLVATREDLINPTTWITNTLTTEATYNSMIVSVNADGERNGVYYLLDRKAITADNYSAYKTALDAGEDINPYFSMWMKLGTLDDLAAVEKKLKELIGEIPEGKTIAEIIAEVKPTIELTPVDGTIVVNNTENGGKSIGVAIAPIANNALIAVDGGLFVPIHTAGEGIEIADNKVSVKLSDTTHGLVAVNGALALNLATRKSDGAMSKEDKLVLDSISYVYETRKYDISGTPDGTLVDYRDREIRIMCPANAEFKKQEVGDNGNADMYYMTFKAYAPNDAVSFKEGDKGVIIDEMFTFDGPASGIDEFGRKYSVCWLALASHNPTTDTWTYFGKNSSENKYIGWDYVVEWFNAENQKIGYDSIRINLSNESCHNNNKPYYMAKYATSEEVQDLKEDIENNFSWGEM